MRVDPLAIKNKNSVVSLAYSEGLNALAIGQIGDAKARGLSLWDVEKKKEIDVFGDNVGKSIWATCFDYKNRYLIYSDSSKIFVFDIDSHQTQELETENEDITNIVSAKSSPRIIVSGKYVEVLDIDSGESVWKSENYEAGKKTSKLNLAKLPTEWKSSELSFINEKAIVEIFNDGKTILIGGHNKGTIEKIETASGHCVKTIFPAPIQAYAMNLGCNQTILAVSSKVPYANFLWDLETENRILPDLFNERFGGYSSICLHSSKKLMANGSFVGFVSLQNLNDGNFVFSKRLHSDRVSQVQISDSSNIIFSGGEDGNVNIIEFDL